MSVRFSTLNPPFAVLAAGRLSGSEITSAPDANLPKDTVPVLTLSDGYVAQKSLELMLINC